MVCDALKDARFKKQPQVKKTCVRIFYNEGYHVDMPMYRIRTSDGQYELADDDDWTVSRAADVEKWFDEENKKSPDKDNGRQFRRMVRDLKKFARSRRDWKDQVASGFIITKLASECYASNKEREDVALRDTMRAIYSRLCTSLEVAHPVTPGVRLTKGANDDTTKFLRYRLKQALADLAVVDDAKCTRKQALAAWDKVFNTSFFSTRLETETAKSAEMKQSPSAAGKTLKPATVVSGLSFPDRPVVPNKPAGFA